MIKELFHNQETFPLSRNFSPVKELHMVKEISMVKKLFHSQGTFLQLWKLSTLKELFLSQGTFQQSWKFSTKFFEKKKTRKIFCKEKIFFYQGSFSQTNIFTQPRKFSANENKKECNFFSTQDSKRFHTPKIINTFHDTSFFYTP